jgi:hypothetical protein
MIANAYSSISPEVGCWLPDRSDLPDFCTASARVEKLAIARFSDLNACTRRVAGVAHSATASQRRKRAPLLRWRFALCRQLSEVGTPLTRAVVFGLF